MNKKIKQNNQLVTKGYLERTLDKRFKQLAKVILDAMDFRFEKINSRLDEHEEKIDDTRTLLDGYVNAQEGFKQEFEVMKYQQSKVEKVINKISSNPS